MFTGLVHAIGRIQRRADGVLVEGCSSLENLVLGESIAVDGVCLTVASLTNDGFLADVSEETLLRTTLGSKAIQGSEVNLEQALRLNDRLGGHLVSGHVDEIGYVTSVEELPNSWLMKISWENKHFGRFICEKASVAVNGISLTVASCSEDGSNFSLAVIPHTWRMTTLKGLLAGDRVNLEVDLLARYTERLLKVDKMSDINCLKDKTQPISSDWLSSHGWE